MVNRKCGRLAVTLLSGAAVVILLNGLLAGVHQNWVRMALYLSVFILNVFIITVVVVILTADRCLKRIAGRLGDASEMLRAPYQKTVNLVGLITAICVALLVVLSWLVGSRQQVLALGICMTACALIVFVSMGVMMTLAIEARFEQLEEIVRRGGITGTGQRGNTPKGGNRGQLRMALP